METVGKDEMETEGRIIRKLPATHAIMLEYINEQVNKYGFFVLAYGLPKKIGQIAPVCHKCAETVNCCIIAKSTMKELLRFWKISRSEVPPHFKYVYRCMID